MQNTGNQNSQEKHADNDEGGHHEGNDVLLRREEIEDRVTRGVGSRLVLQLQTGLHVNHLTIFRITLAYTTIEPITNNQVKTLQTKLNYSDQVDWLDGNFPSLC